MGNFKSGLKKKMKEKKYAGWGSSPNYKLVNFQHLFHKIAVQT